MEHLSLQSYFRALIIGSLFLSTCASAMEQEPPLDNVMNAHAMHLVEIMREGESLPTAVWDGSRGFYDTRAKQKNSVPLWKKCIYRMQFDSNLGGRKRFS